MPLVSGTNEAAVEQLAQRGATWLKALLARRGARATGTGPDAEVLTLIGPAPCPVERIKNRWRWHVLLKAEHPGLRVIPRTSPDRVDAMIAAGAEGAVVTFAKEDAMRAFAGAYL